MKKFQMGWRECSLQERAGLIYAGFDWVHEEEMWVGEKENWAKLEELETKEAQEFIDKIEEAQEYYEQII